MSYIEDQYQKAVEQRAELRRGDRRYARMEALAGIWLSEPELTPEEKDEQDRDAKADAAYDAAVDEGAL